MLGTRTMFCLRQCTPTYRHLIQVYVTNFNQRNNRKLSIQIPMCKIKVFNNYLKNEFE